MTCVPTWLEDGPVADLRDKILAPKGDLEAMTDDQLFLAYHEDSHFAQVKVARGLLLTPESRKYMRDDLDRRARLEAFYKAEEAKEKAIANGESKIETTAPVPDDQRGPAAPELVGILHPDKKND